MNAALAAEEAKRQEALERHARDTGETKWVFSSREDGNADSLREGLRVERVESGVEVNGWGGGQGRRLFGTFKKKVSRGNTTRVDFTEGFFSISYEAS